MLVQYLVQNINLHVSLLFRYNLLWSLLKLKSYLSTFIWGCKFVDLSISFIEKIKSFFRRQLFCELQTSFEFLENKFPVIFFLTDAPRSVWVNASSEVMEGSSVTLHCEVDSNPPARIAWMFGDQELLWDTASNVSLMLDDVTPANEGIYTCVGDNGYGIMNTSLYLAVKCKFLR